MDLPDRLSKEDSLELQNYALQIELLQLRLQVAASKRQELVLSISRKYQIDPDRDTFDTDTLLITRAKRD